MSYIENCFKNKLFPKGKFYLLEFLHKNVFRRVKKQCLLKSRILIVHDNLRLPLLYL